MATITPKQANTARELIGQLQFIGTILALNEVPLANMPEFLPQTMPISPEMRANYEARYDAILADFKQKAAAFPTRV